MYYEEVMYLVTLSTQDVSHLWARCHVQANCAVQLTSQANHLSYMILIIAPMQPRLQFVHVILPERCYYICTAVQHSYTDQSTPGITLTCNKYLHCTWLSVSCMQ